MSDIMSIVGGGITASIGSLIIGVILDPLRHRLFGPKINISFDNNDDCKVDMESGQTLYRLRVKNCGRSKATSCQPYIRWLKCFEDNKEVVRQLCEPRPLKWAFDATTSWDFESKGRDIHPGDEVYIDLGVINKDKTFSFNCKLPNRFKEKQKVGVEFLCEVIVTCVDAKPALCCFELVKDKNGNFDFKKSVRREISVETRTRLPC